jgi:hypothetical protein
MRISIRLGTALLVMLVPLVASAQFKDLDAAMSNLNRGFGSGDAQAIVAGISEGEKVMLEFPGLLEHSGIFGRDQAAYILDGLFGTVKPAGFEQRSARGISAESQYYITGRWTIQVAGKPESRDLYITLKHKNDHWSMVSVRSASK